MAGSSAISDFILANAEVCNFVPGMQNSVRARKQLVIADAAGKQAPRQDQALLAALKRGQQNQKTKPAQNFFPLKQGGVFNLRSFICECIGNKTPPIGMTAHCEAIKDMPHIQLTIETRHLPTYAEGYSTLFRRDAPPIIRTQQFAIVVEEAAEAGAKVSIYGHGIFGKNGISADAYAKDEPQLLWDMAVQPGQSIRQPIGAFIDKIFKVFQHQGAELDRVAAETGMGFQVALAAFHNKRPAAIAEIIPFPGTAIGD